jgi:predicted nuclease of restriction endonuclease-like (RecB) superfamily
MKKPPAKAKSKKIAKAAVPAERAFDEVVQLIERARERAFRAVNAELVGLYWQVGEYISRKIESAEWGDGVVDELATHIARTQPGLRGFTRRNLFRMRQFFETYRDDEIVSPLVSQLPWTHHLIILSQTKRPEEREFYVRMAIAERWTKRELERQFQTGLFARTVLNPPKVSTALTEIHPGAASVFKDAYVVEFLGLPREHSEADLHGALLRHLTRFLVEMGRDFCFVGTEYPLQVGGRDFALDLLFFHRGLNALVAIELKAGCFEPEHLGKLNFYLEALDRDVRKPHERPSIGVLLCATKDDEVVEYALSRSLSPTLIAEYETKLPAKALLRAKLHELYAALSPEDAPPSGRSKRKEGKS